MSWVLEQPDSVLSQFETTKQLDSVANDVIEEIQDALKSTWGSDTEQWHEIDIHAIMQEIFGRVVNRVFVGLPLCRHPGYLQCSTKFAQLVNVAATFIKLCPRFLQPVIAPILTAYDSMMYRRISRYIMPMIRERASQFGLGFVFVLLVLLFFVFFLWVFCFVFCFCLVFCVLC